MENTILTDAYHPGPSKAAAAAAGAPAATDRAHDDQSQEVEAEGRRSASAPSSDRTTSQPRRSQVFSRFQNPRPHAATQETEHQDSDRHRSHSDHEQDTRSRDLSPRYWKTILITPTEIPSIGHPAAHLAQPVEITVRPPPDLPVAILVILPETLLVSLPVTFPRGTANPAVVSQPRGRPVSQNHNPSL